MIEVVIFRLLPPLMAAVSHHPAAAVHEAVATHPVTVPVTVALKRKPATDPFPYNGPPPVQGQVTYVTPDGMCAQTGAWEAKTEHLDVVPRSECGRSDLIYRGPALPPQPKGVWVKALGTCWFTTPANAKANGWTIVLHC